MITYLDPGMEHEGVRPYDLVADLAKPSLSLKVIDNGFNDADRFRAILADTLAARFPQAEVRHWTREGSSDYTAGDLAKLEGADGAILLWGH